MENNTQGNRTATPNPQGHGATCRDWHEERRAWRQERREARYRYPFHGLFLGLTLVLLGVLFGMNQAGWLTGGAWWQSLLIGLGVISIINGVVHYRHPDYRWGSYGKFIAGIILILIGTLFLVGFSQWWPVVLVVAGVAVLLRFAFRR